MSDRTRVPSNPDGAEEGDVRDTASIVVYGASDDLIEVESDNLREEFYYTGRNPEDGRYLAFDDGTVLRIRYSNSGVWRIEPVMEGDAFDRIDQAPEDDDHVYSDRAYLRDDPPWGMRWVVLGTEFAKRRT